MADADLDAIRQRRMAELLAHQQAAGAGGSGLSGGAGGGMPASREQAEEMEEQRRAQEEQRGVMLHAVITPEARARLARIALVKPDKARRVEEIILNAARRGQLPEKVSEQRLVELLEQIQEKEGGGKTKVTIQRRRPAFDDDD